MIDDYLKELFIDEVKGTLNDNDYNDLKNKPSINDVSLQSGMHGGDLDLTSEQIKYDSTSSGISSENVQTAIDELESIKATFSGVINTDVTNSLPVTLDKLSGVLKPMLPDNLRSKITAPKYESGEFTLLVGKNASSHGDLTSFDIETQKVAGRYIRVGKMCFATVFNSVHFTESTEGYLRVSDGLPFTPYNEHGSEVFGTVGINCTPI